MMAVTTLFNVTSEVVTMLYPVLTPLFLNYPPIILYIFSLMGILLQLMFTSEIPTVTIPSLIMIFLKVSHLCWLVLSDALPIPFMF